MSATPHAATPAATPSATPAAAAGLDDPADAADPGDRVDPDEPEGLDDQDAAPADPAAASRAPWLAASASDAQLLDWLAAVADHDEQALTALYDATAGRVHGLVLRIVRRAALAEEVVEETFFQVWRQAARFDPQRGGAMTWLLAMARSRAIDAIRREARFHHEALPGTDGDLVFEGTAAAPGCDELLDAARNHAELHRALMLLSAQPRQLVALAFFRGLSHEEIASQTALPLGTVKSQIRRALITLAQVLGQIGPGVSAPSPPTPCPS